MDTHGVQRMTRDRNRRAHVMLRDRLDRRAARILRLAFSTFAISHAIAPSNGSQSPATRGRRTLFLATSLTPLLSACDGPLSTLAPAGPAATRIAVLWWAMLAGGILLLASVLGLLWWAYRKPAFAARISTRTWLLHGGVLMPVVVLTALVTCALFLGERLVARPAPDIVQVDVVAMRWGWVFHYPQFENAAPTTVLHIPAGQPVDVRVISHDVSHSFWVPRLGGKIDAIPGHVTRIRLQADVPGRYDGVCAEFCGIGHATMTFQVIAHAPDEYRAAVLGAQP